MNGPAPSPPGARFGLEARQYHLPFTAARLGKMRARLVAPQHRRFRLAGPRGEFTPHLCPTATSPHRPPSAP